MTALYRYALRGRSLTIPGRVIRLTVNASSADDARRIAAARIPDFGTTLPRVGVRRLGRVVVEPEQADPMTQAKAREFATWRDTDVEVV